jgi:hypothetical protein
MTLADAKLHWIHLRAVLEPHNRTIDNSAVVLSVTAFFGLLPHLTMLVTFVWSCIRLYETQTVQGLLARWRARKDSK